MSQKRVSGQEEDSKEKRIVETYVQFSRFSQQFS